MKTKKSDILEAEELTKLYEKGSFAPHSLEKIFNDSKYNYNVLKSAPFFGEETLGIYLKIYGKLGEMGYAPAYYELGLLNYTGEWWLTQDLKKSLDYHTKAAELYNTDAMFELYTFYSTGQAGVKQNDKVALEWCKKAAEKEHYRACYNMGSFYAAGRGVPQDIAEAVKWYERASTAGNGKASATLGVMYKMGQEIEGDAEKAEEYFKLSEEQLFDLEEFLSTIGIERYESEAEKPAEVRKRGNGNEVPTIADFKVFIEKLCKATTLKEINKVCDAFYSKKENISVIEAIEVPEDGKLVEEWVTLVYDRTAALIDIDADASIELSDIASDLFR